MKSRVLLTLLEMLAMELVTARVATSGPELLTQI